MAEYQRIHPVSVESPPPSAPAALSPVFSSGEKQAPPQRTLPGAPLPPPRRRRSCCCRCMCWTLLTVVVLVVAVAATAGILYLVFDPKLPKYSVDRLRISNFTIDLNNTITATFNVTVTARNPNRKIGIYYGDGSHLSSWYNGQQLCAGSFPAFYQGHRNTTVLNVLLTGETQMGSQLVSELLQQQQSGMIPLAVRGDVPVRVKFGRLRLRRVTFKVRCALVVNSLTASADISIRSDRCRFRLKF
ncbi:NDR1/HIN1-like protein 6 [Curcuma longa]|uniref:NDR1/HIN1-like protein 6 n=1 Tax=Curcuma longa TaxID=136217 RepID=UPI003D9DBCCB